MNRRGAAASGAWLLLTVGAWVTFTAAEPARSGPVELDAVVLGRDGNPAQGLVADDFHVKDDGRPVKLTSFRAVSSTEDDGGAAGRVLVLLLDDGGAPPDTADKVQQIARAFVSYARPQDKVAVIRLTHGEDGPFGTRQTALDRIDEYRARSPITFGRDMRDDMLQTVARVARSLEAEEHQRKVLVCIGNPGVCDPYFPQPKESLLWPSWRAALAATARADASVYFVNGVGPMSLDLGSGLVESTGGDVHYSSNDIARAARTVWDQAGNYYLLGYTPTSQPRDLHAIKVSVARVGLQVRVRTQRGD